MNRLLIWLYRPVIGGARSRRDDRARPRGARGQLGRRCGSAPSSCPTSTRARCSTCRRPAGHLGHQGRRAAPDAGPASSSPSRRWRGCGARPGGRRPRPTRRRPRCSRRHQPQARDRMAAGRDGRRADRRDGQGVAVPRCVNTWTMPIKARIDMLSTGIRTPSASRCSAPTLARWSARARDRGVLQTVPGTTSAYRRARDRRLLPRHRARPRALARYGLMVGDVQDVIAMALGGEPVTTTVEGRERYTVAIRYPRDCAATRSHRDARCWSRRRRRHRAARPGSLGAA